MEQRRLSSLKGEKTTTTTTTAHITTKRKRQRKDTFWVFSDEENSALFQSIMDGNNDTYRIDKKAHVKRDWKGKDRVCWRVYSLKTELPATTIRSTKPYRLAMIWALGEGNNYLGSTRKAELQGNRDKILGKTGDHHRHQCGNHWCCNPRHIIIGSRSDNEIDKHFHYFLNHSDPDVREKFRGTFCDLLKAQNVW